MAITEWDPLSWKPYPADRKLTGESLIKIERENGDD